MNEEPTVDELKEDEKKGRTWTEEIEIAGSELVTRFKELVTEGNVRRVIIRNKNGDRLLEVPLTAGVAVGGVLTLWNPVLAALGALAALIAEVRIEVVREKGEGE